MTTADCTEQQNLAQTLALEMKAPIEIGSSPQLAIKRIAVPPGWDLKKIDEEDLLASPRRKHDPRQQRA